MPPAPASFSALIVALTLIWNILITAEALCFIERGVTTPVEHDAFTCLHSKEFQKDLNLMQLNSSKLVNVIFREGKIPNIEKDAFKRIGTKALAVSVIHSGLVDVDQDAFSGLTELKVLNLRRNRLVDAKKGWFKDLSKLESLDLSGNMICQFDTSIFSLTPMIQEFDISENQLSQFDIETMQTKWPKLKKVGLQPNPYEWGLGLKIVDYSNLHPSIVKNSYASVDGLRDTYKIVKECQNGIKKNSKKDEAKELDTCVRAKLAKAIENPQLLDGGKPEETPKPVA